MPWRPYTTGTHRAVSFFFRGCDAGCPCIRQCPHTPPARPSAEQGCHACLLYEHGCPQLGRAVPGRPHGCLSKPLHQDSDMEGVTLGPSSSGLAALPGSLPGAGQSSAWSPQPPAPPIPPLQPPVQVNGINFGLPMLLQLALHRDCSLPCSLAASGLVYLLVQHQVVAAQSMLHRLHLQHSLLSRLVGSTLVCLQWLEWQQTAMLQAVFLRLQLQHRHHPMHLLALPPPLKGSGHRALLP